MSAHRPSLLVAVSAHGYGHLAQTAEVVNALRRRVPELEVTVRADLPQKLVAARVHGSFTHLGGFEDVGMRMGSALDVALEQSAVAYCALHADWSRRVEREAARLVEASPDLVLANVPHLALAAAAEARIPGVALCSLNWADIYEHYFRDRPEASAVLGQIRAAYRSAAAFLQPEPSMPMPDVPCRVPIEPIAGRGRRRAAVKHRLGMDAGERLVLVAPGGVSLRLPVERWPQRRGLHWVMADAGPAARHDVHSLEALEMPFLDVLASCDALLTKPGYGSFAEAACNGIPVLYVPRGDWPEEDCLTAWLERRGRCAAITREQIDSGEFFDELDELLGAGPLQPVEATGAEQAATCLSAFLTADGSMAQSGEGAWAGVQRVPAVVRIGRER